MIRRFGRRAVVFLPALALAALWLFGTAAGFALGEETRELLRIQMTAQPEEMVEPGDVTLSFAIENVSGTDAQSVYLSSADGLLSEPVGQIDAGETQAFSRTHSVTADELSGGEITYIISHDDPEDPGRKVNYTVSAPIRQSDKRPQAEFTRQFSGRSAAADGTLTVAYRVRNTGNVALTNLRVQDKLGDYTGRVERLEVGDSRTLISRVTVTEAAASSAVLSYNADGAGDEVFMRTLEDVSVGLGHAALEHSFSAVYSAFDADTADVVLALTNLGDVDCRNVRVTDELYGGVIADELTVPANGDPVEISHSYAVRGDGSYCWRVTGVYADGEEIDFTTDIAALAPGAAGESAPLRISAEALTPRIRHSGDVTLRVRIANPGGVDVREVLLSEETLGALRSFAILPAGGTIERDVVLRVEDDAAYSFSISYVAGDGAPQSVTAAPVEVVIAPDGVLPEGAKPRFFDFSGKSIKIGGSSTFAVLLIAGCVVLLALIVMLLIATRRARIEKQLRIAAERQRRKEELGKTNRFMPVRAPKKNRGKGRNS